MGYYSYVTGNLIIIPDMVEMIKKDIEKANNGKGFGNGYLTSHISHTDVNEDEDEPVLVLYDDTAKWYRWQEFIEWLTPYIKSGEIEIEGEEQGDMDGYRFKDGKITERLYVIREWRKV